jgi:hypothetical protein
VCGGERGRQGGKEGEREREKGGVRERKHYLNFKFFFGRSDNSSIHVC